MPVSTSYSPVPSITKSRRTSVSRVLRSIAAVRRGSVTGPTPAPSLACGSLRGTRPVRHNECTGPCAPSQVPLRLRFSRGLALATGAPDLREPQLHRLPVPAEALELGEADHVGAELAKLRRLEAHEGGPLQEVVHAERREETSGAPGGKHVVRACEIVADRDRRVVAEEHRACVRDALEQRLGRV